jgi:hypothetical protein
MSKTRKPTIVYVRWFDASYQRGECTLDELTPRVEMESAGLLVQETKHAITLALDHYRDDETYRYILHIPKVNVLKVKRIKL